jgi:hypothetical protein
MLLHQFLGALTLKWKSNENIPKELIWNLGFLLDSPCLIFLACGIAFLNEECESVLALIEKSENASLASNDLSLMKLHILEAANDPHWIDEMKLLSLREFDLTGKQLQLLNEIIIQGGKKRFFNLIKE